MPNTESNFGKEMSDNLALAKTLAHHDAAISGLGTRMSGVESGLSHVNEKVSTLDSRVAQGFGEVLSQIREGKAAQGPGLPESIKMAVGFISIAAAATYVVAFLVTAKVEPQLQKITDETLNLSTLRARDEAERHREYEQLKEERKDKVDHTLQKLAEQLMEIQTKVGWGVVTIEKGPRK